MHNSNDILKVATDVDVVVVGTGIGGLATAIRAADLGLRVQLIEKGEQCGGATAYSGGQVWVGANHVASAQGLRDTPEETLEYVMSLTREDDELFDVEVAKQWIEAALTAARYFEDVGVIKWEVISDYPDYFPDAPGAKDTGRYLTGALFPGEGLGSARDLLLDSPHFPSGITPDELSEWGGVASKNDWDWELITRRGMSDMMSFGHGIAAAFLKGVVDRSIPIALRHSASDLMVDTDRVVGVRCDGPDGTIEIMGAVVLATGSHDWADFQPEVDAPRVFAGSVAPQTISGDALELAARVGAGLLDLPPRAAPRLPGYRLPSPQYVGDSQFRVCAESALPHSVIVNRSGARFCDESFYGNIVRAAFERAADGGLPNGEPFLIWDETHHQSYGLGLTMPGASYPEGLVTSAETLAELADKLGIDGGGLTRTVEEFNEGATEGVDRAFGPGTAMKTQSFKGDSRLTNPSLGPVASAPFFGMPLLLLRPGIPTRGINTGPSGQALTVDGEPVHGLFAVGWMHCSDSNGDRLQQWLLDQ